MKHRIYELIKESNNHFNSVMLGKKLHISPDDVRQYIQQINKDTNQFMFGIISVKGKYRLAIEGNDFKSKVLYYKSRHQQAIEQQKLWEKRQDMVSYKMVVNGKVVEVNKDTMDKTRIVEEPDFDTIKEEVLDYANKTQDYEYVQMITFMENSTNPSEERIEFIKDYWRGVVKNNE